MDEKKSILELQNFIGQSLIIGSILPLLGGILLVTEGYIYTAGVLFCLGVISDTLGCSKLYRKKEYRK